MSSTTRQMPQGFWQELHAGWRRQSNVIYALIFKDFKNQSSRGRLGLFWLIVEPLAHLVVISTFWYLIRRQQIDGIHVALFLSAGILIYLPVRRGLTSISGAIRSNDALLNYPQVKPISCIFARYIFEMTLLALAGLVMFFALWWGLDLVPMYKYPFQIITVFFVTLALGLGCAIIIGVYATLYEGLGKAINIVSRPLMLISCVIHSLRDMPNYIQDILLWNPLVHLVNVGRLAFFGIPLYRQETLEYPIKWAVITLGLGFLAYYANRSRLIQE